MTEDEDVLAAAVLHDAPERTLTGEGELRETVGSHVTELVLAAAAAGGADPEDRGPGLPAGPGGGSAGGAPAGGQDDRAGGQAVRGAAAAAVLQRLGEQVWGRCRCGREALGWYYQAMTDALQDLNAYPVWHELANAVWELFWQERDTANSCGST